MADRGQVHHKLPLESVWDYPLPPAIETSPLRAQVIFNGFLIADSTSTVRVLQTGLPPAYYFSPEDVELVYLRATGNHSHCGYKGRAAYYDVQVGDRCAPDGAWTYREPAPGYEVLTDRIAFYPNKMDACLLGGEPVRIEAGDESGGWVTSNILGLSRGYPRYWDSLEDTR